MISSPSPLRTDSDVQSAARQLFFGCAPERTADIDNLWTALQPVFSLAPDSLEGSRFILDAGAYRYVRFNHRVMRAFWIAAHAAWAGYTAVHAQIAADSEIATADLSRFQELIEAFEVALTSEAPELEPLPDEVPEPGSYPATDRPERLAPSELATFAVGWALLHEACHLKHQQELTTSTPDASPCDVHHEELLCDAFATNFLLERVTDYATKHNVDPEQVARKRRAGICFALFTMTLVTKDRWGTSPTHPSMQNRIDATLRLFGKKDADCADAIVYAAFCALRLLWPGVPMPDFQAQRRPA